MEGDVITLQDIFAFDHSAGLRQRRPRAGHASGRDRAATQAARQAPRLQRHGRPDALRDGRVSRMQRPGSGARAPAPALGVAFLAGVSPLGRPSRGRRRRRRSGAGVTHARSPATSCGCSSRCRPGTDLDLDEVTATVDGLDADARAEPAAGIDRRTPHRDPRRSTPATRCAAPGSPPPARPRCGFLDLCPTTSTSASSPSTGVVAEPLAPEPRPRRLPGPWSTASSFSRGTRLYDGVDGRPRPGRHRGSALAAGALRRCRHERHAARRGDRRGRRRRRSARRRLARRPDSAGPALQALAQAGSGTVVSSEPDALDRGVRRRGRCPGPPGAGARSTYRAA